MAWRVALMVLAGVLAGPAEIAAQGVPQRYPGDEQARRLHGSPGLPFSRDPEPPPMRSPYWPRPRGFAAPSADPDEGALGSSAAYRTFCVRLCDGFYFPISSATGSAGLARDADMCTAGCGSEARLFYQSVATQGADTMVDLTGLGYGTLANAFKYRRALVPDCRCRPQPWSETELQRHQSYAADKTGVQADAATPAPAARPEAAAPGHGTAHPGEQPEPVDRDGIIRARPPAGGHALRPSRSRYVVPHR